MKAAPGEAWVLRTFGELFKLKHGYAFKGEHFSDVGPYIVLTPGNFYDQGGFKHKSQEKYYTGDVPEGFILSRGDLLVAMTEQAEGLLGSSAFVPADNLYLHNQRLGLVADLDTERLDRTFLYYLLNFQSVRDQIRATANGAKVRHTSPSRIYEVTARLPDVSTQQKIASILRAYDDLIDSNLRRIAILQAMAQTLYREWFVKFRSHGRDEVGIANSPLGGIPVGWEVLPIKNLGEVILGGTPSRRTPSYWANGTIPWLKSGKLNDIRVIDGTESITQEGLRHSATKLMPRKTVLIAITGAILLSFLEIDACANQSVVGVIASDRVGSEYLHLYLQEHIDLLKSKMSGSAQQHVNKSVVEDTPVLVPPPDLVARHSAIVKPQYDLVAALLRRNKVLARCRQLLLHRLVSGVVDVSRIAVSGREEGT